MKRVDQTIFDAVNGNCLAACIASILEVELAEVPNFCEGATTHWLDRLAEWLAPRGLYPLCFTLTGGDWRPQGLHILAGKSPRGDWLHAVVARGRDVVHDPHPSRAGVLTHADVTLFITFDPVAVVPSQAVASV